MSSEPRGFIVETVTQLPPDLPHDGMPHRLTALHVDAVDVSSNTSAVSWSWRDVPASVPLGVKIEGDPLLMLRAAEVWQQHPEALVTNDLLAVPFVAAHLAHAIVRRIPASEITALARDGRPDIDQAAQSALVGWLVDAIARLVESAGMPPTTPQEAETEARGLVSLDRALAAIIEKTGKHGAKMAKAITSKAPTSPWARWRREVGGGAASIPALMWLAGAGWLDVVKPRLEREAEEARKQQVPIRFPQPAAQALTSGRTATVKSRKKNLAPDETWADWTSCVTLALPSASPGVQLALPLPSDVKIADGNTLQSVLTGGLLRTYLATWALWADNRSLLVEGGFAWDEETVIRRYLKKTGKISGHLRDEVRADLARLCQIRVVKAGVWNVQDGSEPLIRAYREDSNGRTVYIHAGVISLFLNDNFSQVPRNVLSLHPDDVALALGLATLARSLAVAMLANDNRHEATLRELAEVCGADVVNGVRKHGPAAYWRRTFDDLCNVASKGNVGKVEMLDAATVPAEGTRVRFTMSDEMVTAYRPLFEAATRRRSAEKALAAKGSRKPVKGSKAT